MSPVLAPTIPFHDPRVPSQPDDHRCEARILAPCSRCRREYPLCMATKSQVDLIAARRWVCPPCESEAAHA